MPKLLYAATVAITIRLVRIPYANHFRALGWQVDAMANGISKSEHCRQSFDRVWDIDWSRNPMHPRNLTSAAARVRSVVEDGGYDLVHVHTPVAGFVTRFALSSMTPGRRPAVIYGAHGFHFYPGGPAVRNAVFLALERLAGRWTDYLMVVNQVDEEAARRFRIVPEDRVLRVPGSGIDLRKFDPASVPARTVAGIRQELGLTLREPLVLMLAEFNPGKRHRDALEAFARASCAEAHLAFAGNGPTMASVEHRTRELGLESRVHFLGPRHDVPALIRASSMTVLPSEREGLPRSIIESMSLGVPVIAADIRGIRDLLDSGRGYLFKVADTEGFAAAIRHVIRQPAEAQERARRARDYVTAYDIRNLLSCYEKFYGKILGAPACTATA